MKWGENVSNLKLYDKLSKDISGKSPYLECTKCGRKIDLSQNGISSRLQNGWEKCCGYTMRYYPNWDWKRDSKAKYKGDDIIKALLLRNNIKAEILLSSTTYRTNYYDKCVYCHKDVENDYYEYNDELIGMPYRCTCDKAQEELDAKEALLRKIVELQVNIDVNTINKTTKEHLICEIDRAYEDGCEDMINSLVY